MLKRFVESESIRGKVCYDTQESLKPILALYPRYAGTTSTLRLAGHTNRTRLSELNFPLFSAAVVTRNLVDPRLAAYVFDPEMKSYDFPFLATSFGVDQSLGQHQALLSRYAQAPRYMRTSNLTLLFCHVDGPSRHVNVLPADDQSGGAIGEGGPVPCVPRSGDASRHHHREYS